ncbi:type I-Fv CRISPR-associated protein Cas5fv [Aliivibrio salmonicida]|uniref:type I-Fv CRISPR-associated protein Cas5fv n=1 Tax=Aliivibrio salmonicida TaxID=40269 RepID=UPI00406C071D
MKITIEYESSWRNSFLDGSNNEALPKTGRKFIGSMTSLKKSENYIRREVTLGTVMGVLNRLIGDQRKLYQSRNSDGYFFEEIEPLVNFSDKPSVVNSEMTYIRNITGSTDQGSFEGAIKANSTMLCSDFSNELWGVLSLDFKDVCEFILKEEFIIKNNLSLNPIDIVTRTIELDQTVKAVDVNFKLTAVCDFLNCHFFELISDKQPTPYVEKNGKVKPIRLYAAALYLQLERLSTKYDMTQAVTKAGKVAGFSKRGFNGKRDFMKNFVTGGEKKVWGNPYIQEEFIKGIGKTRQLMTKASGTLEIEIDISREKAKELEQLIENAGVSSFYLGKKGLAYVSNIRI